MNILLYLLALVFVVATPIFTVNKTKEPYVPGVGLAIQSASGIIGIRAGSKITFIPSSILLFIFLISFIIFVFWEFSIMYLRFYIDLISIQRDGSLFDKFGKKLVATIFVIFTMIALLLAPHVYFTVIYAVGYLLFTGNKPVFPNVWDSLYLSFGTYYSLTLPKDLSNVMQIIGENPYTRIIQYFHVLFGKLNELIVLGLFVTKILNVLQKEN